MQVIFLQDVPRVGSRHEVKEVNGGYAINFLFPRKLAEAATPQALAELEGRKKKIVLEREVQAELLARNLEEIKDKVVHIKAKADEKGHLFSAIHPKAIVEAMRTMHGADISEELIALPKPIKAVGEFEIPIRVKDKKSSFKLVVERI
jgi:large subunit ribosomal protein L9